MATIAEKLDAAAITDNLNRLENPIAGEWKYMKPGKKIGRCSNTAGSEGYTPIEGFLGGEDATYWGKETFSTGVGKYIYGLFQFTRIGSAQREGGIWLCRSSTAPETTESGYYLRIEKIGASPNLIKYSLEEWVNGSITELNWIETSVYGDNSRIALLVGGGKISMYASVTAASAFQEVMTAATTTHTSGYSGLMARGTGEFVVKNFATGTLTEPSRKFAEGDLVKTAVGANDFLTNMTMAVLFKAEGPGTLVGGYSSSGLEIGKSLVITNEERLRLVHSDEGEGEISGSGPLSGEKVVGKGWILAIVTHEAGGKKPKFYWYYFETKDWEVKEGSSIMEDGKRFTGGSMRFGTTWRRYEGAGKNTIFKFKGSIAAAAKFSGLFSESEAKALQSVSYIWQWLWKEPKGFWLFNQDLVGTSVEDISDNGANQTELVGTTVAEEELALPYRAPFNVKVLRGGFIRDAIRWIMGPSGLRNG